MGHRGNILVSTLIALAIAGIGAFLAFSEMGRIASYASRENQALLAQGSANELLEGILSLGHVGIMNHLNVNPVNATFAAYKLCAHINLLDRTTNQIINRDPMAADVTTQLMRVNRFYQIFVLDLTTMQVDKTFCDKTLPVALSSTQVFLVSVGVGWDPAGKADYQQIALSGIVPK